MSNQETFYQINQKALIQTLSMDIPIVIEYFSSERFIFTSEIELPMDIRLFVKNNEDLNMSKTQKTVPFEIKEVRKEGTLFHHSALFLVKPKWSYEEWLKNRKKNPT